MTTPTQGEHAQTEALFYASALENCAEVDFDRIFVPAAAVIRRLHAQVAALTAPPAQPAAPQCVAYAELDDAFESWLEDQDVDRLSDGYESWLNSVRSCWDSALRASHGQAPAGAADEMEINRPFEDPAPPFNQWRGEMQSALKRAGVYAARSPGAGNKLTLRWRTTREDVLPTPTAQAAPAAGAVVGPVDDIDAIALARYKVVPAHESMFHRFAVVAGDGKQQLYLGRETECQNMARKFAGAFLDGAFHQSQIAAAPTSAAQADSVLEDAARWFSERDNVLHSFWVLLGEAETQADNDNNPLLKHQVEGFYRQWNALNGSALEPRWVTRAARKQGAKHD